MLPSQPPEEFVVLPEPFLFEPGGATFDPPLALTFNYEQEAMPEGGIEELTLGFYYIDAPRSRRRGRRPVARSSRQTP